MQSKIEILAIADQRLIEGEILIQNGRYSGGCYLAGYVIELYLKAVCTQVENKDDLFTETNLQLKAYKKYRTHDLDALIDLAHLRQDLQNQLFDDDFNDAWFFVTSQTGNSIAWSEKLRYKDVHFVDEKNAKRFIKELKIIVKWLETFMVNHP